ncbi:hypothetical protein ABPG74_010083 [Tetrahymena malaccensis]
MTQKQFVVVIQYKKIEFKKPEYYLSKLREVTQDLKISFQQDEELKTFGIQGIGTFIELKGLFSGHLSEKELLQILKLRLDENKLFPTTSNVSYKKIEFKSFQDYSNHATPENTQYNNNDSYSQDYKYSDQQQQLIKNLNNSQTHDKQQKNSIESQQLNNNKNNNQSMNPNNDTSKNINIDNTTINLNFKQGLEQQANNSSAFSYSQQQFNQSKEIDEEAKNDYRQVIYNHPQEDLSQSQQLLTIEQASNKSEQQIHQAKEGDEEVKNVENNQVEKSDEQDQINSSRQNSQQNDSIKEIQISDKQDLPNFNRQSSLKETKTENQQLNQSQDRFLSNDSDDGNEILKKLTEPIKNLKDKSNEDLMKIIYDFQTQIKDILKNGYIITTK